MKIKKKCQLCGKKFEVKLSPAKIKLGYGKYCSHKCLGKAQIRKIKKECLICNKKFYVIPARIKIGRGKFCSRKCKGIWHSQNRRGEKSTHWKGSRVYKNCLICGKKFYASCRRLKRGENRFCSKECYGKWLSENKQGKNSPSWRGGISKAYKEKLSERQWNKIRWQVYKRDDYQCQICGKTNLILMAHHIIPYRVSLDDSPENLITLCCSCHSKEEHKYYKRLKGQLEFSWVKNEIETKK